MSEDERVGDKRTDRAWLRFTVDQLRFGLAAGVLQLRSYWLSPSGLLSAIAVPCVYIFVVQTLAASGSSHGVSAARLFGASTIGYIDATITLVVLALTAEKVQATIGIAIGGPSGAKSLVAGRLLVIPLQALTAAPAVLLLGAVVWGLDPSLIWWRYVVGSILLAVASLVVLAPLAYVILRFPYSAGMTNGIPALLLALGGVVVPAQYLPSPLGTISQAFPFVHLIRWGSGGTVGDLVTGISISLLLLAFFYVLLASFEKAVRRKAISLVV